ncbi:uncharacterized [Tachysurus ichikawai]
MTAQDIRTRRLASKLIQWKVNPRTIECHCVSERRVRERKRRQDHLFDGGQESSALADLRRDPAPTRDEASSQTSGKLTVCLITCRIFFISQQQQVTGMSDLPDLCINDLHHLSLSRTFAKIRVSNPPSLCVNWISSFKPVTALSIK